MPTALVTGGSAGLGRALAASLARDGWQVFIDGRDADRLAAAARGTGAHAIAGDVCDPPHREQLVRAVADTGRLDLLVNNASTLGPTPLPPVAALSPEALDDLWLTNVAAPLALAQSLLPLLRDSAGALVSISSDAAVEHYEGWGGYGATKAALDHLTLTLAAENPGLRRLRRRPRGHAHGDAPGGVPGGGHQRPARCRRRSSPRLLRAARAAPGERSLPRRGLRGPRASRCVMSAHDRVVTALGHAATRFPRPDDLTATEPPEQRGLARDEVRLLVATPAGIAHARFRDLPAYLAPGDLLVVNNSATLRGGVRRHARRRRAGGRARRPTRLDDGTWVVELRTAPDAARPVLDAAAGERIVRRVGLRSTLLEPYPRPGSSPTGRGNRLWRADGDGSTLSSAHLLRHGRPIAYGYLARRYPLAAYQTVFASRPGSAEMPSAARPFTAELVTDLIATRRRHRADHAAHRRLVAGRRGGAAAGALRGARAHRAAGQRHARRGRPGHRRRHHRHPGPRVGRRGGRPAPRRLGLDRRASSHRGTPRGWSTASITGWHNPEASHLLLVESVAGAALTQRAYDAAVERGYLWHEFGDSALLLP